MSKGYEGKSSIRRMMEEELRKGYRESLRALKEAQEQREMIVEVDKSEGEA